MATALLAAPPAHRSESDQHDHDCDHQRDGLGQEAGVIDKKFHVLPLGVFRLPTETPRQQAASIPMGLGLG
jgi:hypothetical protein